MLHILILMLKIIGIILLAILGIAILLLVFVLFVPVHYSIVADTPYGIKNLTLRLKASWMFPIAHAHFDYENQKWDWKARVLWKQYTQLTKSTATEPEKRKKKKRYTIRGIYDKIRHIKEYVSDKIHQAAFARVIREIIALLKRLKPKKIKGKVRFGLKEPYDTGRVLAVLSVLYPFYGDGIVIDPEFDQEVLEGHIEMKGRSHLLPFVITIFKIFMDENVQTAYQNMRRK